MDRNDAHRPRCSPDLEARVAALEAEKDRLRGELLASRSVAARNGADAEAMRDELARLEDTHARLVRELIKARQQLVEATARASELENSTSFRLGYGIVTGLRSPAGLRNLATLPWRLLRERAGPGAPGPAGPAPSAAAGPRERPLAYPSRVQRRRARPEAPDRLAELRVAAVMDEFTRSCFLPTCRMRSLHADDYEQQLLDIDPHLLLVESAWNGEGGSWRNKVAVRSGELLGLLDMCRRRGIPAVFWNKEDPSHFDTFLETARLFDHVFTTDIDSIRRYRAELGHDRVHLLPFACQPRIHNPVVDQDRRAGFSFAGSYYHRYPERCEDFERMVRTLAEFGPVVVYDRNSARNDPAFAFPEKYAPMLRPALPYDRIDEAYKGYRFAINLTTIKQSQSMFARRVYELLASNTVTVSNYSRGIRQVFGDLVVASDDVRVLRRRLRPLLETPAAGRRLRLQGLRKVMREHTYEKRMQYLAARVLGRPPEIPLPGIVVTARVRSENELRNIREACARQAFPWQRLVLVAAPGFVPRELPAEPRLQLLREDDAAGLEPSSAWSGASVAALNPADHYGPHYLHDLVQAMAYSDEPFIGKGAFHAWRAGAATVEGSGRRYRRGSPLLPRACLARAGALANTTLSGWLDAVDRDDGAVATTGLSIDEFNYCRDGAGKVDAAVDGDIDGLDAGLHIDVLLEISEGLDRLPTESDRMPEPTGGANSGGADFRATPARHPWLAIAGDAAQFASHAPRRPVDRFACQPAPARSFVEHAGGELMQGTLADLDQLLAAGRHQRLWACAPDAQTCRLLRAHASRRDIRVRLTDADLDRGETAPWLDLLEAGYPRIQAVLDGDASLALLERQLGRAPAFPWLPIAELA